ncbi:MAG: sigma-54-dependent Fis family transcriptional regulator [Acidobacteria bacterium]|nr:MAG: sigma-54-dependent Fis family transcriptional regulator [Acidobacteriota bacterium]
MMKPSVLIVDDDQSFRTYVTLLLRGREYPVEALENGDQLIARLKSAEIPSVILLDVLLPDSDGIEVIGKIKAMGVSVPVIMLSGVGHVRTVVEAMKLGASDFLMKPFDDSTLERAINNAVELSQTPERVAATPIVAEEPDGFVTRNPKMRRLADIVKRVAGTDVPILIAGESGVGKEVMARFAHHHSERRDRPFLKVNCAALPQDLLESELFGYERGAFTGAVTDKPGKFELAHTGTLLLDEIGEMSPLLQAKLLHVLQDGTFSRLGGRKTTRVDARVIAATNINIEEAVAKGKFREDLYFRLNVIRVDLPPLRERREDIPELCNHFIEKYREQYKSQSRELPAELMSRFVQYQWPGNIRELENFIKRFLVLPNHESFLTDFNVSGIAAVEEKVVVATPPGASLLAVSAAAADRAERELVRRVLGETRGNRKQAALKMNICYKALLNKLKRWGGTEETAFKSEAA